MTSRAVSEALADEGLRPGDGLRDALTADDQAAFEFLDGMSEQAATADGGPRRVAGWSGKGRKPGSKNVATKQMVEYIRAQGVDPLIFWGRGLGMSLKDFRDMMGKKADGGEFSPSEWLAFRERCATQLAGYMHPKSLLDQMLGDGSEERGLVVLGMAALAAAKPGEHGAAMPTIGGGTGQPSEAGRRRAVENQEVSDDDA